MDKIDKYAQPLTYEEWLLVKNKKESDEELYLYNEYLNNYSSKSCGNYKPKYRNKKPEYQS